MTTCTLRIGDRVVLSSAAGAPEVEYALFDPGEIELAATGPGMVVEVGYETIAEAAVARLRDAGITWDVALETAAAMQPTLAIVYARGPAVRRIATSLGAAELFDGFRYDSKGKQYDGRWVDLPALARDLAMPRFTHAVQAMHLLALLTEIGPDDPVQLTTRDLPTNTRPGTRSYRRAMVPEGAEELAARLRAFASEVRDGHHGSMDRSSGPSATDVLELLRDRSALSPDPESKERLRAIDTALGIRQRPMRGPLSDPELWALDEQLSLGRPEGVGPLIDALEKARGKQPATTYLRIRAAFVSGREPPRAIAERITSLALSMPSFVEMELLAAEAWTAAGEPKRALPFARDLMSNAGMNDELRARESQQFAAVRPTQVAADTKGPRQGPPHADDSPLLAPRSKRRPDSEPPTRNVQVQHTTPGRDWALDEIQAVMDAARDSSPPNAGGVRPTSNPPLSAPLTAEQARAREAARNRSTQSLPAVRSESKTARPLKPRPSAAPPPPSVPPLLPPPASSRKETPPMVFGVPEPILEARPPALPTTGSRVPKKLASTWTGPPSEHQTPPPGRPTASHFAAVPPPLLPPVPEPAPPDASNPMAPSQSRGPLSQRRISQPQMPVSKRPTTAPAIDVARKANQRPSELMRGASQPPFRSDSPEAHFHIPRAPGVPRFADEPEAATALALPEGLSGVPDPIEALPRTVIDARIQFTFLSRELGREYDEQLGITLRADISGIEAMQRVLLERYQGARSVASPEAAADVRRHGAFLSEILARNFAAFWVDIGPSDVGYWAMVVPPATRVWPFGRVLRLIAMQHNERDLVSYFLELQGRAAAR